MKRVALLAVILGLSPTVLGQEFAASFSKNQGCLSGPMEQFGRYIGDWAIADEQLAKDGSAWSAGKGARWIFGCVGDGVAVQDFWLPNGGGFGTNLRTYNADTSTWEIVWAASSQQGLMQISAKERDDGAIEMNILKPEQVPPRRIIFYPPDAQGWNWVSEMSFDDRKTWIPVYKIKATPYQSAN